MQLELLSGLVILTSVTLALLQYFENSNRVRVANARHTLRDKFENLLPDLSAMLPDQNPMIDKIRQEYDNLSNFRMIDMGVLLKTLFSVFFVVVFFHAARTFTTLKISDTIASFITDTAPYVVFGLEIVLIGIVAIAGFRLYKIHRDVAQYETNVESSIKEAEIAVGVAHAVSNAP
jgi:hypothetical protein